jgi:hypothetical protein
MYFNRFQQGDSVSYTGTKLEGRLGNKEGVVLARVGNTETEVVVEFNGDAYIIDEEHLAKARKRSAPVRNEDDDKSAKVEKKVGVDVEHRKGVGGGKRHKKQD